MKSCLISLSSLVSLVSLIFLMLSQLGYAQTAAATAPQATAESATIAPAPLHITKLEMIDTVVGSGEAVVKGMTIEVHYTGWIYNHKAMNLHGTKFDSSLDAGKPLEFEVGAKQVINGWEQGVIGMKVGGKRSLKIPAYLAYSTKGSGNIPPNTHLIFDVELVAIKKK